MSKVITLLLLLLGVWYWSYTQRAKTLAIAAARKRCMESGLQFLDHTVVQRRLAFYRDENKRWYLAREYQFEFTSSGEKRYQGCLRLLGQRVLDIELEPYSIN